MITQHSFSVIPEGHPLRRRYTATADYGWVREPGRSAWTVRMDGLFVADDLTLGDDAHLFDEAEALALAERAAAEVKLYTQHGDMTATEALKAGLQ